MIISEDKIDFTNTLDSDSAQFTIEASAKMFDILSNKIYENVPRAIIRELSCNAIDANIDAKCSDPIRVYLPTPQTPSLIIEDSGIGMSHEDVMTVYRSYGKSTKAGSNKVIGALGIGGKTPLAYTQQFTLETAKDGKRNSYIIYKDDQGIPNVNLVNSVDCNETGTSVEMVVKPEDVEKFIRAAVITFVFFDTMPIIIRGEELFYNLFKNSILRVYGENSSSKGTYEDIRNKLKNDFLDGDVNNVINRAIVQILYNYNATEGIIMGQVFYNINSKLLFDEEKYNQESINILRFPIINSHDSNKILHVDIGSVSIQPSREALNYNKKTIDFLKNKFYAHFEDWSSRILQYKTPYILKNFNKIYNMKKLFFFREKENHKNPVIKSLATIEKSLLKEAFKSVYNDSSILFYATSTFNSFSIKNLLTLTLQHAPLTDSNSLKDTFDKTFYDEKIKDIIILDDQKQIDKLLALYQKHVGKNRGNTFTCPIAIRNRLKLLKIDDALVVNEDTYSKLKYFRHLNVVKFSEIVIPKETASVASRRKKVDTSGKCFYMPSNTYKSIDEVLQKANGEKITYEFFEGVIHGKGWFYNPKTKDINAAKTIRNKQGFIDVYHHGNWIGTKEEKYRGGIEKIGNNLGLNFPKASHHCLIDWAFYKKNLINSKDFIYINDFIIDTVKANLNDITNLHTKQHIYLNSVCSLKSAIKLLKIGTDKYPSFDQTDFGIEMNRIIIERSKPEFNTYTMANDLEIIINHLSSFEFAPKPYDTEEYRNKFNNSIKICQEAKTKCSSLHSNTLINLSNNNINAIKEKYKMLELLTKSVEQLAENMSNTFEIIVDYVAAVEGLI
jgi:hypothetical protein